MFFIVSTSSSTKTLANVTRVKVYLKNGAIEIFDGHQHLMGIVDDLVEVETLTDNKVIKFSFVLQQAVFIVSPQGLENSKGIQGTSLYFSARRFEDLSEFSLENIRKEYQEKVREAENQRAKQNLFEGFAIENPESPVQFFSGAKLSTLENEVQFLEKVLSRCNAVPSQKAT